MEIAHVCFASEQARQKARFTGHRVAVMGIRKEDLFLRHKSLREYQNMGGGTNQCGDPGSVNQGQNEHLSEHRRVIRMAYITKGARGNHAESRKIGRASW